jgi:ribosomal protein S18 acetylase RimI-like enzyme
MRASDPTVMLRPATAADAEAIATVWHEAWRDGHLGHVPDALLPHRTPAHFRDRVPTRLAATTVATLAGEVIGFVTVHDDEVEQVFVIARARGRGVADALLRHGEGVIARRFAVAWLSVVAGNARARRFYEKSGWRDTGGFLYEAEIPGGTLPVPSRRYEKRLAGGLTPAGART